MKSILACISLTTKPHDLHATYYARTTTHKPTRLIHPREKEKRKRATLWTRYLAKTAFSQNFEEVKVINMVDFLFNPSDVFASNAGSSLRKRRRDRVPESFIHANVIIVAVFVFSWGWGTLAFWPARFLFLADFTLSDVILTGANKTGLVPKLRALRAPL